MKQNSYYFYPILFLVLQKHSLVAILLISWKLGVLLNFFAIINQSTFFSLKTCNHKGVQNKLHFASFNIFLVLCIGYSRINKEKRYN